MRTGEIHHLDNVPALHGGSPKGRYVVVVTPEDEMILDRPIYVVACTASLRPDAITDSVVLLPWHAEGRVSTGFRRLTYALPEWLLKVRPSDLSQQRSGYLRSRELQAIIDRLPPDPFADLTEL